MIDASKPRAVAARRMLTLTTVATTAVVGFSAGAESQTIAPQQGDGSHIVLAQAAGESEEAVAGEEKGEQAAFSGEGEGEGGISGDPEQALQRDIGFMEGHMRAGLELYESGDLAAAKTHMGHPIEEKYGAVAGPLAELGFDGLRQQIEAVAAATEAEASFADVKDAFDAAQATMDEVRAGISPRDQMLGLGALVRVAGDEYAVAVAGGEISNLHEYQDSWGFLRVVETGLSHLAESDDPAIAEAGREALGYLGATDAAFGDIQGEGPMEMDPSILYGAAARIELVALELD